MNDDGIMSAKELHEQERAMRDGADKNWAIRIHRAVSWLERAEDVVPKCEEAEYIFLWIALSSLYGSWNSEYDFPKADSVTRPMFVREVLGWAPEAFKKFVERNRKHVLLLIASKHLTPRFWHDPRDATAGETAAHDAGKLDWDIGTGKTGHVLEVLLDRMYLLRSQIVHGGCTAGSYLNRQVFSEALYLLRQVVPLFVQTAMLKGKDKKWPPLCYPPQEAG